jgi:hypothetical protein
MNQEHEHDNIMHEHNYQLNGTDTVYRPEYFGKPIFPLFKNVIVYSCECGAEVYEDLPEEEQQE